MTRQSTETQAPDASPDSETLRLLQNRRSIRAYTTDPVAEETVEAILEAAFRAPTSSNIQAYSVVVVRDHGTKDRLAEATRNQQHVAEASVFLGFCADLTRIAHAMAAKGHAIEDNNLETCLLASIDATLVGMSVSLAAESVGLKSVMIGAVRNRPADIARILGLPRLVYCVFGMCLGYGAEAPKQKPRLPFEAAVHYERYDADPDRMARHIADYDRALCAHYGAVGKPTTPDSWCHDMDVKFTPWPRDDLREVLRAMGFKWR